MLQAVMNTLSDSHSYVGKLQLPKGEFSSIFI